MGTVTISFLGVCTIFRDLPKFAPPGAAVPNNRVVLARVTEELQKKTGVDPHIAKLQFVAENIEITGPALPPADPPLANTYSLTGGVGLRIKNATGAALGPPRGLDCLPSLAANLDGTLGLPASWVFTPDAAQVQAWFDFEGGEALAFKMKVHPKCDLVPSIMFLTLQTNGDPELEFTPFGGSTTKVKLSSSGAQPPNVNVMNFAFGEAVKDDDNDFLLNYTLTTPFPPVDAINIPHANVCTIPSPLTYDVGGCGDAGPGCSNSTYP